MNNEASITNFYHGVGRTLARRVDSAAGLPDRETLLPCDGQGADGWAQIVAQSIKWDDLIVNALRPNIKDKSVLMPGAYQHAVQSGLTVFKDEANKHNAKIMRLASALLDDELQLMAYVRGQRNILKGA